MTATAAAGIEMTIDTTRDAVERLSRLERIARDLGADARAAEIRAVRERVAEGRFFVACIGQFKRGKSTLLNALVGDAVLPAGVVPVTATISVLRFGAERRAVVRLTSGEERAVDPSALVEYVAEAKNPDNVKGVAGVEVYVPSPLLGEGLCLVDTPGVGSIHAGNTATTRDFVPHIDAALVVIGADPPLSGEELALVAETARSVSELIFVMNKADRLAPGERQEAREFAERAIAARIGERAGTMLEISAAERLATGAPTRDWQALEDRLSALGVTARATLVGAAAARAVARSRRELLGECDEKRGALARPLHESERRLETLERVVASALRSLDDLGYRFKAEQERIARALEARRRAFVEDALPKLAGEAAALLRAERSDGARSLRERAASIARDVTRRAVTGWIAEVEPFVADLYRSAAQQLLTIARAFLGELADADDAALKRLADGLEIDVTLSAPSRYYFDEMQTVLAPTGSRIADVLRSEKGAVEAASEAAAQFVEHLLQANTTVFAGDVDQRVLHGRRSFELEMRERLSATIDVVRRAADGARTRHEAGTGAVEHELARLESIRGELERA